MRIALGDIARPMERTLRDLLPAGDEVFPTPDAGGLYPPADVMIASRVGADVARGLRLRLLQVAGAGLDKIAMDAVPAATWICNAYEHDGPIAEYVFAAMLDATVGLTALAAEIPKRGWAGAYFGRMPHGELAGRTVGIVGYGHIGKAIARRAKAFDMRVMVTAATRRDSVADVDWIGTPDRLGELLEASDFVVLACVLTDATRGMIDAAALQRMKRTAVLINIARAEIAVEEDLFRALEAGTIGGAVLDPWYRYPAGADDKSGPSRFPFGGLANVRMTPHAAAWTDGLWQRRSALFARNIALLKAGQPLLNVVRAASPQGDKK